MAYVAEAGHGWLTRTALTHSDHRYSTRLNIQSCVVTGRVGLDNSMRSKKKASVTRDLPVSLCLEITPALPKKRIMGLSVKCANSSGQSLQPAESPAGTPSDPLRKQLQSRIVPGELPAKKAQPAGKPPGLSTPPVSYFRKASPRVRPGPYLRRTSGEIQASPGAHEQTSVTRSNTSKAVESSLSELPAELSEINA